MYLGSRFDKNLRLFQREPIACRVLAHDLVDGLDQAREFIRIVFMSN